MLEIRHGALIKYSKWITFHPDWYLGTTIVSTRAFRWEEVSCRGLEPVPPRVKIPVTNRRPVTNREVVIETSLGLPRDDLVISFVAGVVTV